MLSDEELMQVQGGSLSSQLLNAISRGVELIFNLGQSLGSSIRRIYEGKLC